MFIEKPNMIGKKLLCCFELLLTINTCIKFCEVFKFSFFCSMAHLNGTVSLYTVLLKLVNSVLYFSLFFHYFSFAKKLGNNVLYDFSLYITLGKSSMKCLNKQNFK